MYKRQTITLSPNQGPTTTINLGAWTQSVDDTHSRLVDVDWNATYPLSLIHIYPMRPRIPNRQSPIQTAPVANIHRRFIGLMEVDFELMR